MSDFKIFRDLLELTNNHKENLLNNNAIKNDEICRELIVKGVIKKLYLDNLNDKPPSNLFSLIESFPDTHVKKDSNFKKCFSDAAENLIDFFVGLSGESQESLIFIDKP